MKTTISLLTVFSLGLVAFVAAEQELSVLETADQATQAQDTVDIPTDAIRVSLTQDGVLTGTVFKNVDDQQQPVTAKVTISKLNGESIASNTTTDDGAFEFESIEPGYYTIIGVGDGYYGDHVIDVAASGNAYTANVPVEVAPGFDPGVVYAAHQDAPVATFAGDVSSSCVGGSCGGGGGTGRGRGGKFRRLLPLVGLVGLVGLAGDNDASPDM